MDYIDDKLLIFHKILLFLYDFVDFLFYLGGVGYFAAALAGYLAGQRSRRWKRPLPSTVSAVRRGPAVVLFFLVVTLGALSWRASLESDRDRLEQALRASPEQYRNDATRAACCSSEHSARTAA